jgi:deoxycytidine triphosphate deaminase
MEYDFRLSLFWRFLRVKLYVIPARNTHNILPFPNKQLKPMPTLLGNPDLKQAVSPTGFIKDGRIENIDGAKYDFCLSARVLKAKFKQPMDLDQLPQTRRVDFVVEPGEVVFVLTQETLVMPDNMMGILIPKRKLSHDGIMILGGLSVDPLYEGKLLIGLYNLSSSPYPIIPGKKLIAAQFYKLTDEEKKDVVKPDVKILDFPDELIRLMQNYKPVSAEAIMNTVGALETKFDNLLQEFRSKDDWFKNLQESMDKQEKTIDKILESLEKEEENRKGSDAEINKKVDSIMKGSFKTAAIVGAVGALIITGAGMIFQYLVNQNKGNQPSNNNQPPQIIINIDSIKKAHGPTDTARYR